jgi:hypothetical protein
VGAWRGNDLAGVVRIATEEGVRVLRGMRVPPEFHGKESDRNGNTPGSWLLLGGIECFAIAVAYLKDIYGTLCSLGSPL